MTTAIKHAEIRSTSELYDYCQKAADALMAIRDDMEIVMRQLKSELPSSVDNRNAPLWPGDGGRLRTSSEGQQKANRITDPGFKAISDLEAAAKRVQSVARTHKKEVTEAMGQIRTNGPAFKAAS